MAAAIRRWRSSGGVDGAVDHYQPMYENGEGSGDVERGPWVWTGSGVGRSGGLGARHVGGRSTRKDHRAGGHKHKRRTSGREAWRGKMRHVGEGRGITQGSERGGVGKKKKQGQGGPRA